MMRGALAFLGCVWLGLASAQATQVITAPAASTPYMLGQSHVPFCLVSSGTMGNNGALSGIVSNGQTYPNAYVYMPSGAISSGSAAGWYYAVYSSTTAATLYNNTYSSGTPTIPASPTAFATTGPGAYTQTFGSSGSSTTNIPAYQLTVPAGSLGPNGSLRASGTFVNSTDTGAKYYTWTFGSSGAFVSANIIGFASQTTQVSTGFSGGLGNRGVTGAQSTFIGNTFGTGQSTAGPYSLSIDTTQSQTFVTYMRIQLGSSTTCMEAETVEILPGVP